VQREVDVFTYLLTPRQCRGMQLQMLLGCEVNDDVITLTYPFAGPSLTQWYPASRRALGPGGLAAMDPAASWAGLGMAGRMAAVPGDALQLVKALHRCHTMVGGDARVALLSRVRVSECVGDGC
jgi:hypothetical protein